MLSLSIWKIRKRNGTIKSLRKALRKVLNVRSSFIAKNTNLLRLVSEMAIIRNPLIYQNNISYQNNIKKYIFCTSL